VNLNFVSFSSKRVKVLSWVPLVHFFSTQCGSVFSSVPCSCAPLLSLGCYPLLLAFNKVREARLFGLKCFWVVCGRFEFVCVPSMFLSSDMGLHVGLGLDLGGFRRCMWRTMAEPVNLAQASQSRLGEMKQGDLSTKSRPGDSLTFWASRQLAQARGISLKRDPALFLREICGYRPAVSKCRPAVSCWKGHLRLAAGRYRAVFLVV